MKHLTISEYGTFLGLESNRLVVKQGHQVQHFPLNRLSTISVAKNGVSISSNLIEHLSQRGIKLFFLNFKNIAHTALLGVSQHGVVAIRIAQMHYCEGDTLPLAKKIIKAKIKNQRAVLNHLNKYHDHQALTSTSQQLLHNITTIDQVTKIDSLLGVEGASANHYFQALKKAKLLSSSFQYREGRGSQEITNAMLNFGYAILSSYLLNAIINAGLEPYLGIMHSQRPGKMALVLDLMEEYRAWVVDRAVIKLRHQSEAQTLSNAQLRKNLIHEIHTTCAKKYLYRKKKTTLETIIQRQIYRLGGELLHEKNTNPIFSNGKTATNLCNLTPSCCTLVAASSSANSARNDDD